EPPALAGAWDAAADVAAALGAVDAPPPEHAEAMIAAPAINPSNCRVLIVPSSSETLRSDPVGDGQIVLSLPYQPDSLALQRERLGRGRREILPSDDELGPRVERDDETRVGAEIDGVPDAPGGRVL